MSENKPVMNQVDELPVLTFRLKDMTIKVSEQLQVTAVNAKLLTWNDYRKIWEK